jgi:hypothetical protein
MREWMQFFKCQTSPVLRSQLVTALLSGRLLEAERVPSQVLLDLALLSTASRQECNAEIVDDYRVLLRRVSREWGAPDWTARRMWSIHAATADFIVLGAEVTFEDPEVRYLPALVAWYLNQDVPRYFKKELAA